MDLSVTDAPDDGTLYKDEDEQWKNYSGESRLAERFFRFLFEVERFSGFLKVSSFGFR
jgi:hypothetical protein